MLGTTLAAGTSLLAPATPVRVGELQASAQRVKPRPSSAAARSLVGSSAGRGEHLPLEQTAAPEGAELWSRLLLTSVRYAAKTILSNVAEKLRQERPVLSGLGPHYARVDAEHESNPARMAGSTQGLQARIRDRDYGWRTQCLWKGANCRGFAEVSAAHLGCRILGSNPRTNSAISSTHPLSFRLQRSCGRLFA